MTDMLCQEQHLLKHLIADRTLLFAGRKRLFTVRKHLFAGRKVLFAARKELFPGRKEVESVQNVYFPANRLFWADVF